MAPDSASKTHQALSDFSEMESELMKDLENSREKFMEQRSTRRPAKIQRVQTFLKDREQFAEHYNPKFVSFGPIHHDTELLKLGEQYKEAWAAVHVFEESTAVELLRKIEHHIEELKELYTEDAINGKSDQYLARMLFVDGCALLYFINCTTGPDRKKLQMRNDLVTFVAQDMVLLENQLPYKVLKLLTNSDEQLKKSMDRLCQFYDLVIVSRKPGKGKHSPDPEPSNQSVEPQHEVSVSNEEDDPAHFLDYLRKFILARRRPQNIDAKSGGRMHFLKKGLRSLRKKIFSNEDSSPEITYAEYRNIQNLKASGILRMKRDNYVGLVDISFHPHLFAGYLHLPPLMIESWTVKMLYNLIAYESCPDFNNELEICSFVKFFSWLINCEEDVKELRSARILINTKFGSDAQVVEFFNNISHDLFINFEPYDEVICEMERYFRSKSKTWIAEAYYTYFKSPWTIIACFGAGIGLLLTSAQTWQGFYPRSG